MSGLQAASVVFWGDFFVCVGARRDVDNENIYVDDVVVVVDDDDDDDDYDDDDDDGGDDDDEDDDDDDDMLEFLRKTSSNDKFCLRVTFLSTIDGRSYTFLKVEDWTAEINIGKQGRGATVATNAVLIFHTPWETSMEPKHGGG